MSPRPDHDALVDGTLMLAFEGTSLPASAEARLAARIVPGFTLFAPNMEDAGQVAALTRRLHAGTEAPRLVAADQEGGQLMGFGDGTPFAGNMALGATGDTALAEAVGRATGSELRAVGITVNYAPVCDVASRPGNPSLGIRSFGEDPGLVGRMAAAMVKGLQSRGVAAVVKHFPGKGEADVDPHDVLPVLDMDRDRFDRVELPPFRAGIEAGARMAMVGHYACPRLTGRRDLPASLSDAMVGGILRTDLGFDGVVITDALDMGAAGPGGAVDPVAAVTAGVDLLLCGRDADEQARLRSRLLQALRSGRLSAGVLEASAERVERLRAWLGSFTPPDPSVLRCGRHMGLARRLAERSITLVRDDPGLLPLRLSADSRMLAVMPTPADLTPADTSSRVPPGLAPALRRLHPSVTEVVVDRDPSAAQISAVTSKAADHDVVVIGTISATPAQGALVMSVLATGTPTVTVALRTPDDLALYPRAATHVCTYGILGPSMDALARALFGLAPIGGRLPVAIPGLHPAGHGVMR